jgi:hypothetical protein
MSWTSFHLSFYALCIVLLWVAGRGIIGGRTIFAFPTLAAMMGLAWVVPQGIELEANPSNIYASEAFWLYLTACFVFIAAGFRFGYKRKRRRLVRAPISEFARFSDKRLLLVAVGLTALGQFANFQMSGIDTSAMGGQWTGVITMWALLSKASGFGLCLAALVFARTRWWAAAAIAAIAVVPLGEAAILSVRREALFDLVILTAGSWYLAKGSYPPRAVVVAALLVGTVILNTAGDIRKRVLMENESLVQVLASEETYTDFDYTSLGQGNASEVGLAQYDVWYTNQFWRWELGAEHWNSLAHQYVPAFILGREFKENLKISTLSQRIGTGEEVGAYSGGSTRTGFSDSYRAFGFLGALIFFAIAFYFGSIFAQVSFLSINGQYLYLVLLAEGMKAITHSTAEFVSALPFTLLIYWLAFRAASFPSTRARPYKAFPSSRDFPGLKG